MEYENKIIEKIKEELFDGTYIREFRLYFDEEYKKNIFFVCNEIRIEVEEIEKINKNFDFEKIRVRGSPAGREIYFFLLDVKIKNETIKEVFEKVEKVFEKENIKPTEIIFEKENFVIKFVEKIEIKNEIIKELERIFDKKITEIEEKTIKF